MRRRHRMGSVTRPEDERHPPGQLLAYGTQHILTMYGGVIAPPLIVGGAAGLSAADLARCDGRTVHVRPGHDAADAREGLTLLSSW